ncbi:hypothetical protein C8J57DRAFT_1373088 [Mycena rebaudengoi]|nr:hypothetical protein C8J57DRAFT_1373088 [Mycena rebaudengoi]
MSLEAPLFPLELERHIFELAAFSHCGMIPTLLRVARRVLVWIEPLLYRVVRVKVSPVGTTRHAGTTYVTRQTFRSKPPSVFQKAIRHVVLDAVSGWPPQDLGEIIGLAALIPSTHPWLLPALGQIQARRLYIFLEHLFRDLTIDLTHPMFASVTHFDVFDNVGASDDPIHSQFSLLPSLTHLCLNDDIPSHVLQTVLADSIARNPPVADRRFVVVIWEDYWADWERGARDGKDFWARADDFMAQKLNGEIEASCYWLDATVLDDEE